mmetsp:Transcript_6585/g.16861  ORF Transcript_6585/g.16861 Transcript_6585/m.16861 type:complete len:655 (-) Transcript_6585:141-2105(-)
MPMPTHLRVRGALRAVGARALPAPPPVPRRHGHGDAASFLGLLSIAFLSVCLIDCGFFDSDSLLHAEVINRYGLLLESPPRNKGEPKVRVREMLLALTLAPEQFAVGTTKAFFKDGALAFLDERRAQAEARAAQVLARMTRGLLARRMVASMRNAAARRAAEEEAERQRRAEEERERLEEEARIKEQEERLREQEVLLRRAQMQVEARVAAAKAGTPLPPAEADDDTPRVLRDSTPARDSSNGPSNGHATGKGGGAADTADPAEVGISFKQVMEAFTETLARPPQGQPLSPAAKRLLGSGLLGSIPLRASHDELLRYAEYLGMDAERDWQLLWIADEALHTPAPPGWGEELDPTGGMYFKNVVTEDVSEQHPNTWSYQQLYFRERVQLLKQLAPHTLTEEDHEALEPNRMSTFRAKVLYNFTAEEAGEMSVRAGDLVTVLGGEVAPEGWWMAVYYKPNRRGLAGEVGLVPQSYVEETVTRYAEQDGSPIMPRGSKAKDAKPAQAGAGGSGGIMRMLFGGGSSSTPAAAEAEERQGPQGGSPGGSARKAGNSEAGSSPPGSFKKPSPSPSPVGSSKGAASTRSSPLAEPRPVASTDGSGRGTVDSASQPPALESAASTGGGEANKGDDAPTPAPTPAPADEAAAAKKGGGCCTVQ